MIRFAGDVNVRKVFLFVVQSIELCITALVSLHISGSSVIGLVLMSALISTVTLQSFFEDEVCLSNTFLQTSFHTSD